MSLSSESILSRTPGSLARSSHVGRQVAPLPEASDDPKASTQAFTCDTNLHDLSGEQAERAYWHLALNCPYKESTARQIADWIQRQRPTTPALAQPVTPSPTQQPPSAPVASSALANALPLSIPLPKVAGPAFVLVLLLNVVLALNAATRRA